MLRILTTAAVVLSLAGPFVMASSQSSEARPYSSSQPQKAPQGGGQERPFHAK
jgi:hypothetical protein